MYRLAKYFVVIILLILVSVGAWMVYQSIDAESTRATKLQSAVSVLANADNGYFQLQGMDRVEGNSNEDIGLSDEMLKVFIYHSAWDEVLIQKAVDYFDVSIASVSNVNQYAQLKVPVPDEPYALPEYQHLVKLNRLVLLKSLLLTRQGHYGQAIKFLSDALQFSQRVKLDQNFYLISYMIGLVMEYEVMLNIHHLSNHPDVSLDHLKAMKQLFDAVPSYHDDRFPLVFRGEYQFSKSYFEEFLGLSFLERWQQYQDDQDWVAGISLPEEGEGFSVSREIYRLMIVVAPKYYLHKNKSLDHLAEHYAVHQAQASSYCVDTPAEPYEYNWYITPTWKDVFTPNSLGVNSGKVLPDYSTYLIRRCFSRAYLDSVKTIIALQMYQRDKGELPSTLNKLSAEYLSELPIDPFNGRILNYDKENQWLRSVGRDHITNNPDTGGLYFHRCYSDDACSIEPIFPASAEQLADEVELTDSFNDEKGDGGDCSKGAEDDDSEE